MATDAACPECGTSIERSRNGDDLGCASPAWLRLVRMGVVFGLAANALSFLPWRVFVHSSGPLRDAVQWGRFLLLQVFFVGAAWLISTREPHLKGRPVPPLHRLLRTCAA